METIYNNAFLKMNIKHIATDGVNKPTPPTQLGKFSMELELILQDVSNLHINLPKS